MPKLTKRLIDSLQPGAVETFTWDSDVKGFGVRLKPSGVKSFVLKYRVGPKTRRYTICKVGSPFTVDQARDKALELLRGLHSGIDPAQVKVEDRSAVSISDLVDAYLADGPALKPNKKASSWKTDGSVIKRHIKPLLGSRLARALTAADVARFQADVAAGKTAKDEKTGSRGRARVTGGPRVAALSTVVLGAAFQFGVVAGLVKTNPTRGVVQLKTERRERFLSDREVAVLAEAIANLEADARINGAMADAIRMLMLTGCRKNEILTLEWGWVDWERSSLRLPDSKTGAKVVPLASAAVEILQRRRREAASKAKAEKRRVPVHVFPAARGDGHTVGIPKAWEQVKAEADAITRRRAGEAGEDPAEAPSLGAVRLHDLRHSFASFAIADGATLFMVGKVLGHKQARTTEGYAHLSDDPLRGVAERTASRIAGAMKISR